MDLAPIHKSTNAHKAADQIIQLILRGVWKPGDQLPSERDMVEQFKVGRSTVREALQILSTLNIVQIMPGQGSFIKNVGADDLFRPDLISLLINDAAILDLIEAREMIEPQTLRLTCLRITDDQIDAIEGLLGRHEETLKAGGDVAPLAMAFHIMLAEASGNAVSLAFIRSILELLQAHRWRDNPEEFKQRELREHRELLCLVRARNSDAAAAYLVRHIVDSAVIDASDRKGVGALRATLGTSPETSVEPQKREPI
ncbi:GntR family transcriptional regulator [Brucella endophytica]|uniref:GntR family transcriptional regulator n=1 Tax=Brucella endophytica TaxID=1963359 RepID=A0A916WEZ1_9HYPH|nr:FadR/GntR family transcriptional regulator [Brucella endophytica]GGA94233.1 GntR family transcriptional regulator [Brucella endophytica]